MKKIIAFILIALSTQAMSEIPGNATLLDAYISQGFKDAYLKTCEKYDAFETGHPESRCNRWKNQKENPESKVSNTTFENEISFLVKKQIEISKYAVLVFKNGKYKVMTESKFNSSRTILGGAYCYLRSGHTSITIAENDTLTLKHIDNGSFRIDEISAELHCDATEVVSTSKLIETFNSILSPKEQEKDGIEDTSDTGWQ